MDAEIGYMTALRVTQKCRFELYGSAVSRG
nr:MAG TPA: hypothetical protein [Caudoviricetes sp.]